MGRPLPDVAELLFDFSHSFKISSAVERVPPHEQKLDQISRDDSSGDIEPPREVGQRKAVVHRDDMRHAVARVDNDTSSQTCIYIYFNNKNQKKKKPSAQYWGRTLCVERQHGLDGDVHALEAVLLEHDLAHLLPVRLGVHRGLREEHLAPRRVDAQLLRERVVPQVLHVLPVAHDPVLHRLRDLQVVPQRRSLVPDHDVLDDRLPDALLRTQDGSPDHRWEHYFFVPLDVKMKPLRSESFQGASLTMFRKVGAGISDLDKLYRRASGRSTPIV